MNLIYISQDAIDDLKVNFVRYKRHFQDETNEWFVERFTTNGWMHESKIQVSDIVLDMDDDYNISDRRNIEIIYNELCGLSPSLASDERLWAGMLFCQFWNYVKYRRKEELVSGNERDILNSFLFLRGIKRSCFMNCLSRLWWTGHMLYDTQATDHYQAVDIICEHAYASNIILISSNNFIANKSLALGIMDCITKRKAAGEKIGRYHFVEANKYLNCLGGASLLDVMTREEVRDKVNARLNKLFGKVNI